jgi:hypothetical protein
MQGFQVKENCSEKVIIIIVGPVKGVKENDTKTRIKHIFAQVYHLLAMHSQR